MSNEKISLVLLQKISEHNLGTYLPSSMAVEYVQKIREISELFINLGNGELHTKAENYYYRTYPYDCDTLYSQTKEKYFIFISTTPKFSYKTVELFFDYLFQGLEYENIKPELEGDKIPIKAKKLLIQTFNKYNPSDKEKSDFLADTQIQLQELIINDSNEHINDDNEYNELDDEGIFSDIHLCSDNLPEIKMNNKIIQQPEKEKILWWKKMNFVFIFIFAFLCVCLYIGIYIFWDKNKDKYNVDNFL